jgi:hypothetical protein
MKKQNNRDDYIQMIPFKKKIIKKYININELGISIGINANVNIICQDFLPESYFADYNKYSEEANIYLVYLPGFIENSEYDYIPKHFIKKSNRMYKQGIENTIYVDEKAAMTVFHYPYHALIYSNFNLNETFICCGNMNTLELCAKSAIKQTLATGLLTQKRYVLHASAVSDGRNAFILLAGGRAGKTTTYLNLLCNGFKAMNDDFIFISIRDNQIIVEALPSYVSIRESSLKYIKKLPVLNMSDYQKGLEGEIYINPCKELHVEHIFQAPLEKIIIPNIGFEKNNIYKVNPIIARRRLIRSLSALNPQFKITSDITELVTALENKSYYMAEISEDTEDFNIKIIDILMNS